MRSRLEQADQATIDRIVYSVAQLSARRRVPEVFDILGELGGLPADALDGMIQAAALESAREQWECDLDLALAEQSELEKELARATGHLARLGEQTIIPRVGRRPLGDKDEVRASVPDEVNDTSEAVLAAQTYLSQWLSVPDSAPKELDDTGVGQGRLLGMKRRGPAARLASDHQEALHERR